MIEKRHVVIAGCGAAGFPAARTLARVKGVEVTVIDPSAYFEWKPALYSILTGADRSDIGFPLVDRLGSVGVETVQEPVTAFHPEQRLVETASRSFPYDYLLVATGGEVIDLGLADDSIRYLGDYHQARAIREQARDSDTITLIGGGVTGVETAVTLTQVAPDASITLLEASDRLVTQLSESSAERIREALTLHGITVKTGEPVNDVSDGVVETKKDVYKSDLIIQATGIRPARVVREGFVDEDGLVVDTTMRSLDHPRVFGAGDAISFPDSRKTRRAYHATKEGRTAAINIIRDMDGRSLKHHEEPGAPIIVSLGGRKALFESERFQFSGRLPWLMHKIGVEKRFLWTYQYFT